MCIDEEQCNFINWTCLRMKCAYTCISTDHGWSHHILDVCVSVYELGPQRFHLSCILKLALWLLDGTAALSSKGFSRLLLSFLSRNISLSLSLLFCCSCVSFAINCWFLHIKLHPCWNSLDIYLKVNPTT